VRLVKNFQDSGISGDKILSRPGLREMIGYCEAEARAGRPIDCIICWKQDRLSRADATHTHAILAASSTPASNTYSPASVGLV
jgi:DNA invertase Pin-like site-specific DNA recombinase